MKIRISIFASLILGVILWQSCSNDLDLNAEWQDIPVVYAFIDINDENHYVRVEKAFLDPETSALEIAQIADSIYYDNISVSIQVNEGRIVNLTRINGEDDGFFKEEGVFANTPNFLYKISRADANFQPGDLLELQINRGDNLPIVTAQTTVVGVADIRTPSTDFNGAKIPLNIRNNPATPIRWNPSEFAPIYDLKLRFTYEEYPVTNPDSVKTFTIVMDVDGEIESDGESTIGPLGTSGITATEFFGFVAANILVKEDFQRVFKQVDIQVTGGGQEIQETFNILNANTGITSAQDIPLFTNLSEGRGIFTSRNKLLDARGLSPASLDSLANSSLTAQLNFLQ